MHAKVGALTMFKFSSLAVFACAASWAAFSPQPDVVAIPNFRLISRFTPGAGSWDNISKDGKSYMGADQLA